MRKLGLAIGVLLLGLGFTSLNASAGSVSVPPVQFNATVDGGPSSTTPGTLMTTECYQGLCSPVSVTLSYAYGNASAFTQGNSLGGGIGTTSFGSVQLAFYVVGDYSGLVPLVLNANASLSVSENPIAVGGIGSGASLQAVAQAAGNYGGGELTACDDTNPLLCGSTPSSFPNGGVLDFSVLSYNSDVNPNYIYITITGNSFYGSYTGTVDPMVSFAPGFNASGLSLDFSPGPMSTTPEPSTLVLLGYSGLLAFAPFIRRKFRAA
jgi:hypothetical protein